jgi:hypothetical protein
VASGAGENRAENSNVLGFVAGPADAVATVDSGAVMFEAVGLTTWTITLIQEGATALANVAATVYITNDKKVRQKYLQTLGSPTAAADLVTAFPNSWVKAPGPSEQAGTGNIANPLTPTIPVLQFKGAVEAIRVVLSQAGGSAAGYCRVAAMAVP